MIHVLVVFGTRPEAIKMCPLVKEFESRSDSFKTTVCVTGQHREMLDSVLKLFKIVPNYDLNVMKRSQTLFDITSSVLLEMRKVIESEQPDIVLVHGDTTTSFAAGLAAFYCNVPIGHVEAGLRTYNLSSPFPEEMNRQFVDVVSDFYFAPTERAKENLVKEGKNDARIFVTGNTGIDALKTTVQGDYVGEHDEWFAGKRLILLTAHRRENLGDHMHHMFRAVRRIAERFEDVCILYPVHLNPRVREVADCELTGCPRVKLIAPLDVVDFHNLLSKCFMVLTDSGGIQEEAPALGKPVLVMRDTTERPEGVAAGTLRLVGTDEEEIYRNCVDLLESSEAYDAMSKASNPYGDGHASERIADALLEMEMR